MARKKTAGDPIIFRPALPDHAALSREAEREGLTIHELAKRICAEHVRSAQ